MTGEDGANRRRPPQELVSPHRLLVAVAILHAVSPLIIVGLHWWFGVDETVYLSQINRFVPTGAFSAPRARGTTFVAAPVTLLTSSVVAVRLWIAALSGGCLYLAYRPWLRVLFGYQAPVAAALFAGLWPTIFYGFEAMPNEWVAFGAVYATGYIARYWQDGARRLLAPITGSMALVALFRPSDAVYLGLGLLLGSTLGLASWKARVTALTAAAVGAAIGLAEWVVEAHTSFHGVRARIHAAQAENGGGGLHFALSQQARVLNGTVLCRRGCSAHASLVYELWWIVLAVLLVVAVLAAARTGAYRVLALPLIAGGISAAQYIFAIDYGAPRFLLPAYALFAIPCAYAITHILTALRRTSRQRWAAVAAIIILGAGHEAIQVSAIRQHVVPGFTTFNRTISAEAVDLRRLGLHRPCLVMLNYGFNENLAYELRCSNVGGSSRQVRSEYRKGTDIVWFSARRPYHGFHFIKYRVALPTGRPGIVQYAYLSFDPNSR